MEDSMDKRDIGKIIGDIEKKMERRKTRGRFVFGLLGLVMIGAIGLKLSKSSREERELSLPNDFVIDSPLPTFQGHIDLTFIE